MRNVPGHCKSSGCKEALYLGGFCGKHYKEDEAKRRRRDEAVHILHMSVIGDESLRTPELRDELHRLQEWWQRACWALRLQRTDTVLQDEAEYAVEWCIALAQEIVDAERSTRGGQPATTPHLDTTRHWVWDRFSNLERGLMSNGVSRH